MKLKYWLIVILIFGAFLRVVNINNNPKSLYGDELSIVYDAYSILKTGHDEKGVFLPLTFDLGGGRPGGYVYATVPFVAIFGLTGFAVRATSILSGVILIYLIYLIGKLLVDEKFGVIAAFLYALSPWDIEISRGGFETHLALCLGVLGFYAFLKAKENLDWYLVSAIAFGLTLHTYPTYRLIIPLFVVFLFFFKKNLKTLIKNWQVILAGAIFVLAFVLSLYQTFGRGAKDRFSNINIFSSPDLKTQITQKIDYERPLDGLSSTLNYLFHNKFLEYGNVILDNYTQNLSLNFLFLHGDTIPRHNPSLLGEFWWVDFFLCFFGLVYLIKNNLRLLFLFLGWIFISPLAASLIAGAHSLRNTFMLPPIFFLSAFGVYYLILLIKNRNIKILSATLIGLFIVEFLIFADRIYFLSANQFSGQWSYDARQASELAVTEKSKYNFVILSDKIDNIEYAYPVYAQVEPESVISQNAHKSTLLDNEFRKYDNVYIGRIRREDLGSFAKQLGGTVLYIGNKEEKRDIPSSELLIGPDQQPTIIMVRR